MVKIKLYVLKQQAMQARVVIKEKGINIVSEKKLAKSNLFTVNGKIPGIVNLAYILGLHKICVIVDKKYEVTPY